MPGIYTNPAALFRAEMAALAHASWFLVPLTLVAGVYAATQLLHGGRERLGRYLHATPMLLLWLVVIGARYYVGRHPRLSRPDSALLLDLALWSLAAGSALGLVLRHTRPTRRRTPKVVLGHVLFALTTAVLTIVGLVAYG